MQTLLLSVFTCAAALLPNPVESELLHVVHDDSSIVVYCESWSNLITRSEESLWTEVMHGEDGDLWIANMYSCHDLQLPRKTEALLPVARSLRGETVLFFDDDVVSLFTAADGAMVETRAAFEAWLPETTPEWPRVRQTVGDAAVEMVSWPDGGCSGNAQYVAYVDHPRMLGLVAADDLATLSQSVTESVARLSGGSNGRAITGMLAARKTAASTRGVEIYVDFSSFAAEAEKALHHAVEGMLPDPQGMLGLEKDVWLYANLDFAGERRIDCNAKLNIPRGTLLAKLADSYGPLPADLPTRLPRDIAGLWSLQWDIERFYQTARASYIAKHGRESVQMIDAGLAAAEGASGVNPMESLIAPLDGVFAAYSKAIDPATHGQPDFEKAFGILVGLENAERFQEAIESLIDMGLGDVFDLTDHNGSDVYTFKRREGGFLKLEGGIALLPREFIFALSDKLLLEHVDAASQVEDASLAAHGEMGPIFDEYRGSCFFVGAKIDWLRQVYGIESGSQPEPPSPERAAFLQPFLDSHAIANATRTPDGFLFRFQIR